MSESEGIATMEVDELLEDVDLGKLDILQSHTNVQELLKELYGVVLVPADYTLSMSGMAYL